MSADDLRALDARHVWHPFTQAQTAPPPIVVREARGSTLIAADGRSYVDLISSWWVTLHGHAEPAIAEAIARQAASLEQVIFAGFTHEPAALLASRLARLLPRPLTRVFFSDDGSTSVEVALKLALQYWRNRGTPRRKLLAFEGGYHGDTFGAMAAGRSSGFYAPFHELLFAVDFVPFPATWIGDPEVDAKEEASLAALDAWLARNGEATAAVILEPLVQGAAGMRMCRPEFLRLVIERVRAYDMLVIFDEVMTGFGRTGDLFACETVGTAPDIVCLSKGLTGGFLPMAATVCREPIYEAFLGANFDKAFAHGHSYTANPLGCAAALASLDLLEAPDAGRRRARIADAQARGLATLSGRNGLSRLRRCGTIAAMTLPAADAGYTAAIGRRCAAFFLERGLLVRPIGNELYLLPPYCVSDDELGRAYEAAAEFASREVK
ncbi:MAG TPA: adenosylmethionine--8-amino-7-oxononanoate transaminase [Alphaproteobacteria bacterium]|nr:adenosylmethionine--8-amino-7-oxononanoate transaminase [Alphaproteobacteria bacterium]